MFKRILNWILYVVIAGILPIGIIWIICHMINVDISYSMISSSIFFFNLMLLADAMKELFDINIHKNARLFLYGISVFLIIIVSIIYGIILLKDYQNFDLNMNYVKFLSKVFTITSFIVDTCVEIMGGMENECE